MSNQTKQGRPRDYNLAPVNGFANDEAAAMVAMLDELSERAIDLIEDLNTNELQALPDGCANTIQMLISHMTWCEPIWFIKATGTALPKDLAEQAPDGRFPVLQRTAAELITEARSVREGYTKPLIATLEDIDAEHPSPADDPYPRSVRSVTVRGLLMHQVWHWTHHTGQVGLVRRMLGKAYSWAMASRITGKPL